MNAKAKALYEEFKKDDTRFLSIRRWRNHLRGGVYQEQCLQHLARFCAQYNTEPDSLIRERIRELQSSDPLVRCNAEDRLIAYYKKLSRCTPGVAINSYRKICSFYKYNYVRLQTKDPGYVVQRDKDYLPTTEEICRIADLVNLETRVFLVTLAETCARPGALANIRYRDIQDEIQTNMVPCIIWLPHKVRLTRRKYFSFMCGDAVKLWRTYLETFPALKPKTQMFSQYNTLRRRILKRARGIKDSKNTGYNLFSFTLHCLRKRGQTLLEKAHVPLNWVDRLLGHVPRGAQGGVYSLPDVEVLRAEYSKAMSQLTIFNAPASICYSDVAAEVTEQKIRQIVEKTLQNLLTSVSVEQLIQMQKTLEQRLQ